MIPELEQRYPEGSDLTIYNTYYARPVYENGKKLRDDFLYLVFKNNITGKKEYQIIWKPEYTYYTVKEGHEVDYSRLFIEREYVDPVTVPFTSLAKSIAEKTGNEDYFYTNRKDYSALSKLHMHPDIFFSDTNIENHYRFKFANLYTNQITKLNKSFFDIEVDGKFAQGDFVQMGECEVNCISFLDEQSDMSYTFILRNYKNPLIAQFEEEVHSGRFGFDQIHAFVVNAVGGEWKARKYKVMNTRFSLQFYDSEIELLRDFFRTIHRCNPDFVEGWNSSSFDLAYLIARIEVLGYQVEDILCDPAWPVKVVKHYIDQKNLNEFAERGDYTFISGYPVFLDQMIQYASRRKSKIGSFSSFKLDDIGLLEAGVHKLDYHHITNSIEELPWLDFKTFVLYNIMDVIVQKCIENKTNDLEYIFSKCVINNTVYQKGHRQTVYLINRLAADFYKMGLIIGNNINRFNEKPPKFLGALVGDPLHTNDYSKLKINGRTIWVCDNLQDYDYTALYPSIMGEFNIASNTQIGRIDIPEKVYEHENLYKIEEEKYSRGGEFIENMVTDNTIEFCHRWFHLAGFEEFLEDIDEFYANRGLGKYSNLIEAGYASPLLPVSSTVISPITFMNRKAISPITFCEKRPEELNYEQLRLGGMQDGKENGWPDSTGKSPLTKSGLSHGFVPTYQCLTYQ